jgi:hypothetical protein
MVSLQMDVTNYIVAPPTKIISWLDTLPANKGAVIQYFFSYTTTNDMVFDVTMPFDSAVAQAPTLMITCAGEAIAAGDVSLSVDYSKFSNGTLTETGDIAAVFRQSATITPVNTAMQTVPVSLAAYTFSVGDRITIRIQRNAPADTYNGNLKVFGVSLKYTRKFTV